VLTKLEIDEANEAEDTALDAASIERVDSIDLIGIMLIVIFHFQLSLSLPPSPSFSVFLSLSILSFHSQQIFDK